MGTWGAALYDDDNAGDLRDSLALLCKVPVPGDRLLEILKETGEEHDPEDEDGALFWLVTADQFERKRIACAEVTKTALKIIQSGSDLVSAKERGSDAAFLKKRTKVLEELAGRLRSPRPVRPRVAPRNPPPMVLETGEIYAFRTMKGNAWHPYRLPQYGPFVPDGWGAMVVLATGRAYDWLPWVALASATLKSEHKKPTLAEVLRGDLIYHSQTLGAGRFVPKPAHARGMGLELLGQVELDAQRVAPELSKWSVSRAIQYDWTLCYGAIGPKSKSGAPGCPLASLLKK